MKSPKRFSIGHLHFEVNEGTGSGGHTFALVWKNNRNGRLERTTSFVDTKLADELEQAAEYIRNLKGMHR